MYHCKLEIWTDSINLIKTIYSLAEKLPQSEEFNLKAQIKRAVVSVALNIAEGKHRLSAKEFSHFLNIAAASLAEVVACIEICEALNYLQTDNKIHEMCKILYYKIQALKNKISKKEKIHE